MNATANVALTGLYSLEARPVVVLLTGAMRLYSRHWVAFSKTVLPSLASQFAGITLAGAGPSHIAYLARDFNLPPYLALGLMLAVLGPGLYLFVRGFWRFLVLMASFNQNVLEVLQGMPPRFQSAQFHVSRASSHYGNLLMTLMALWSVPIPCIGLAFWLAPGGGGALSLWGGMAGLALGGFLFFLAGVFSVYFSLAVQVFVFEPEVRKPFALLKRSFQLVEGNFWRTTLVLVVVGLLSNMLVPSLVTFVCDVIGISSMLEALMDGSVRSVVASARPLPGLDVPPVWTGLHGFIETHIPQVTREINHSFLLGLTSGVLMPLGCFCQTLLYRDLMARKHNAEP